MYVHMRTVAKAGGLVRLSRYWPGGRGGEGGFRISAPILPASAAGQVTEGIGDQEKANLQ